MGTEAVVQRFISPRTKAWRSRVQHLRPSTQRLTRQGSHTQCTYGELPSFSTTVLRRVATHDPRQRDHPCECQLPATESKHHRCQVSPALCNRGAVLHGSAQALSGHVNPWACETCPLPYSTSQLSARSGPSATGGQPYVYTTQPLQRSRVKPGATRRKMPTLAGARPSCAFAVHDTVERTA